MESETGLCIDMGSFLMSLVILTKRPRSKARLGYVLGDSGGVVNSDIA